MAVLRAFMTLQSHPAPVRCNRNYCGIRHRVLQPSCIHMRGRFAQLRGTAPTEAAVGEYHLCFSLDGVFFIPMAYNYFTTHASIAQPTSYVPASSSIATFMFYNMSITGQSLFQGPSDTGGTPYHLTILVSPSAVGASKMG